MSSIAAGTFVSEGYRSTTVRQFGRAVGIALGAVALGCVIYGVETYLIQPQRRFLENPTEVMMRALGLAHFWVGWLFLFTSTKLRSRASLQRLGFCTLLGAGFCAVYFLGGAGKNPLVLMGFYSLFLVHEVRDQADLFQIYGDAPGKKTTGLLLLNALRTAVSVVLITVLACAYLVNGLLKQHPTLIGISSAYWFLGLGGLAAANIWLVRRCVGLGLQVHGDVRSLVQAYQPLLLVYGGIGAILVLGSLLGSVGFNLIILIHVTSWLVFVPQQLRKKPMLASNPWTWLRGTATGFMVLHLSVAGIILMLLALRVYAWERSGWLSQALAGSGFPYWSLMHIGMSFWRGR